MSKSASDLPRLKNFQQSTILPALIAEQLSSMIGSAGEPSPMKKTAHRAPTWFLLQRG